MRQDLPPFPVSCAFPGVSHPCLSPTRWGQCPLWLSHENCMCTHFQQPQGPCKFCWEPLPDSTPSFYGGEDRSLENVGSLPGVTQAAPHMAELRYKLRSGLAWIWSYANTEAPAQAVWSGRELLGTTAGTQPRILHAYVEVAQTDIPKDQFISWMRINQICTLCSHSSHPSSCLLTQSPLPLLEIHVLQTFPRALNESPSIWQT